MRVIKTHTDSEVKKNACQNAGKACLHGINTSETCTTDLLQIICIRLLVFCGDAFAADIKISMCSEIQP